MLVSRARLCAPGQPPQIDKKRLESLFARMTVISNLCQSRLALPLHYPLHGRQLGRPEDEKNPIASSKWSEEEVKQTLAAVTPAVIAISKVCNVLKAAHALDHYVGGEQRQTFQPKVRPHHFRLNLLRQQILRKGPWIDNRWGLGQGWEKWATNEFPVDDKSRRWRKF